MLAFMQCGVTFDSSG